ncbi:DUF3108 domain-containing protein [Ferrimonas senticii]|uniref:DUF3108 domain-containing protein n=1 Tax=Ferrimonas senticii TaxID=394566 RepID=UPI00040A8300|nr:DUF3108 domain-containing protein [Ferrimonas senticii]
MYRFVMLLTLLCGSVLASPFTPYDAHYELSHGDSVLGEGRISLTAMGDQQYQVGYVSDASFMFLSDKRSEQSLFRWQDEQIVPLRYFMERTGSGPDFSEESVFDQVAAQIHSRYKDEAADLPLTLPVYDNILYMVQLTLDLTAGKQRMEYQYIRKLKQRDMIYEVIGNDTLTLPYGTVEAVKLQRVRSNNKRQTYLWIAPQLANAIVKIEHYKEGKLQGGIALKTLAIEQ